MSRNIKPSDILKMEGKSHRTKEELRIRKEAELAALSGKTMTKFKAVKEDKVASKEFDRVKKMMVSIGKDDSLYETVINRYCEILSECEQLKEQRTILLQTIPEIRQIFKEFMECDMDVAEKAILYIEFVKSVAGLQNQVNKIDGVLASKRTMLFNIEKENIFTIASALRSIPKKEVKKEDPLLQALKGG